jgi:hypothetical protein
MSESLKFGPEWLRNSIGSPTSTDKLQDNEQFVPILSDFRYSKEEFLSLMPMSRSELIQPGKLLNKQWRDPVALNPQEDERTMANIKPFYTNSKYVANQSYSNWRKSNQNDENWRTNNNGTNSSYVNTNYISPTDKFKSPKNGNDHKFI